MSGGKIQKATPKVRVPNRIWRYLKQSQYRQKELAKLLGHKTATSLCRWMNGIEHPSLPNAMRLAVALSTSIDALYPDLRRYWEDKINPRREKIAFSKHLHRPF